MQSLNSIPKNWLITGGLGYIGAHVARELIANGFNVVLLDNLSSGLISRKPEASIFVEGDVQNSNLIKEVCSRYNIEGVIHLASNKHARESRHNPVKYWVNNVGGTLGLVQGLENSKVSRVIFSSSCSIYGNNSEVVEGTTDNPQSTYAYTKKVSEDILVQSLSPKNIALVNLRFFNVIGCDTFSNAHDNSEECLVPVIANHLVNQSRMKIFGTDHPTKDGTCLRDYIDVRDLARAHGLVAREMGKQKLQTVINVSTGIPVSVLDVIKEFERVAGKDLVFASYPADAADPVGIWSQQSRTLRALGWNPEFSLTDSIKSHWYSLTK